jgi:hypothetical protein
MHNKIGSVKSFFTIVDQHHGSRREKEGKEGKEEGGNGVGRGKAGVGKGELKSKSGIWLNIL